MRGTNSTCNAHAGCEHTAAHPTRGLEIPPRGAPGWTTHHFGAGHADRCPRGLQFPHHPRRGGTPPRNTPAHRGPSGLARRARTYPWREPRGHFSPPRPRRVWVTIGRLPACFPGKATQWHRCHNAEHANTHAPTRPGRFVPGPRAQPMALGATVDGMN